MSGINEIERNYIRKNDVDSPSSKSNYPKILPMTVNGYQVRYNKSYDEIEIGLWDGSRGVARMTMQPAMYNGIKAYSIGLIGLNPEYQGQRIGYELYKGLVTLMGVNLLSVGSHSPGARKLWARLSKDPAISAYGIDVGKTLVFKVKPNKKGNELTSTAKGIKVYSDLEDVPVGLILVKKGSKDDQNLHRMLLAGKSLRKSKPDVFGVTKYPSINH